MVEIIKGKQSRKWRTVLYSSTNLGKTTLAGKCPKSIIVDLEGGAFHIDCDKTPKVSSYPELIDMLREVIKLEEYETITIDSLTKVSEFIDALVLEEYNRDNNKSLTNAQKIPFAGVISLGYGKWVEFMRIINTIALKKNVILIAHSQIITVNDPSLPEPYDKTSLAINKKAINLVLAEVDFAFYIKPEIFIKGDDDDKHKKGVSNKKVYLFCEPTAAYDAKKRADIPEKIERNDFDWSILKM